MTVSIGIGTGDTGQFLEVEMVLKEPRERDADGRFVVDHYDYFINDTQTGQRIKIVWPEALVRNLESELQRASDDKTQSASVSAPKDALADDSWLSPDRIRKAIPDVESVDFKLYEVLWHEARKTAGVRASESDASVDPAPGGRGPRQEDRGGKRPGSPALGTVTRSERGVEPEGPGNLTSSGSVESSTDAPVVLYINRWESRCGACGKSAAPDERAHDHVLGYSPGEGCHAVWTHVSSHYADMDEDIVDMRPDLILIPTNTRPADDKTDNAQSRSQLRRVAAQKGEPMPTFNASEEGPDSDYIHSLDDAPNDAQIRHTKTTWFTNSPPTDVCEGRPCDRCNWCDECHRLVGKFPHEQNCACEPKHEPRLCRRCSGLADSATDEAQS